MIIKAIKAVTGGLSLTENYPGAFALSFKNEPLILENCTGYAGIIERVYRCGKVKMNEEMFKIEYDENADKSRLRLIDFMDWIHGKPACENENCLICGRLS